MAVALLSGLNDWIAGRASLYKAAQVGAGCFTSAELEFNILFLK